MIYLRSFTFPDGDREFDYCMGVKRKCYSSYYPFRVLSQHRLERIDFEPVTILCGSNGSGKSTALQVIARKAGLQRESPYNRTSFFDDYVSLCRMDAGAIPPGSRVLASDDVFDRMIAVRELNDGIDSRREDVFEAYMEAKRSHVQLRSMEDYASLKRQNQARRQTQSRFVREELGMNVRTFSNGENAFKAFTGEIGEDALYLLDEPENSLSPRRAQELAQFIEDSARFMGCQFVIATHSPFVLAIRGAKVYDLDSDPVTVRRWTELESVRETYAFFERHRAAFERESGE